MNLMVKHYWSTDREGISWKSAWDSSTWDSRDLEFLVNDKHHLENLYSAYKLRIFDMNKKRFLKDDELPKTDYLRISNA
jgi:hypothetical protein